MNKLKYKRYLGLLFMAALLVGCSDEFLDRPPIDALVSDNFYQTADQVLSGSAPLYNVVWFAYNDKASHGIGDARGGVLTSGSYQEENILMRTSAETAEVGASWRAFYNVVGQSNMLINNINNYAGENVPEDIKKHAKAEARFMRAVAYYYLVSNWNEVPIIVNNLTLLQDTTIAKNTRESVWQLIIKDMRYAADNLPETSVQEGRLNQWSVEGMLAKMYLTRAGLNASPGNRNQSDLDSALYYSERVINNSGTSLMPEYADLFKTDNNNNSESLFALQWVYNAEWGTQNSVQAFLAYSSEITGFADGWGGDIGASLYMMSLYEGFGEEGDQDAKGTEMKMEEFVSSPDKRLKATFMLPGTHYPEITQVIPGQSAQELRVPVNSTDEEKGQYNSRVWVKKYIVGRPEDNGGRVLQQRTENNTYMLRLADVYLIYTEALLGNNSSLSLGENDPFNLVRKRAGLDWKEAITWDDIFKERLKEFAMEGQAWYDLVRLFYYDEQKAMEIIETQDRLPFRVYPDQVPNPTAWSFELPDDGVPRFVTVSPTTFYLPIPATEMSAAPNLRKEAVPFDFSKLEGQD